MLQRNENIKVVCPSVSLFGGRFVLLKYLLPAIRENKSRRISRGKKDQCLEWWYLSKSKRYNYYAYLSSQRHSHVKIYLLHSFLSSPILRIITVLIITIALLLLTFFVSQQTSRANSYFTGAAVCHSIVDPL